MQNITILLSIIIYSIGSAIKYYKEDKEATNKTKIAKPKEETLSEDKKKVLDKIIEEIKEKTQKDSYIIKTIKDTDIDIYDSKFGGLPYWDLDMEFPKDENGNKLFLLAQFNFEKEQLNNDLLPKEGILQFYISQDDLYGCNFDKMDDQKNWRIIYHKNIKKITKEDILNLNISTIASSEYPPLKNEYRLEFQAIKDYGSLNDAPTIKIIDEIILKHLNTTYRKMERIEGSYLYDKMQTLNYNHKLLGYPAFAQDDPREDNYQEYDTLLFQMDSNEEIMWGDSGVCNFFINKESLKKKDFSKVIYHWDCY